MDYVHPRARCSEQTRLKVVTQSYGATAADRRHARRAASVRPQIEFGGPAFFLLATPGAVETAMSLPRMRGSIVALASLTVAIVVGCELPVRPRDGSAVVQLRIVPESVALDPSQTQGFVASGRTAGGDSMAVDVTWTTSAGTITPAGVYTADTSAADAIITATLVGSQVSGVAHVRKRRVAQVILSPAAVSLRTGGTQQFAAWGVRNT